MNADIVAGRGDQLARQLADQARKLAAAHPATPRGTCGACLQPLPCRSRRIAAYVSAFVGSPLAADEGQAEGGLVGVPACGCDSVFAGDSAGVCRGER